MGLFSRKKKAEAPAAAAENPAVEKAPAEKAPAIQKGIPAEVIAVIAAAVACVIGGGAKIVGVRRSTRSGQGKTAWRNAGVADNTRAF